MANLVIKAPQLGIIDPILDVYFAKVIEKDKGILLEKLEEAYLYQKVSVVVELPQKVATLLYLKSRLYSCNKETNKGEVFKVQQKGKEVDTIEMTISSNQKEGEVVYTAIAEIDLYTQDKEKMGMLESLSPLNTFIQLTWGIRDFNPQYSLKLIKEFIYKDSYFYHFFGEGKWFKIKFCKCCAYRIENNYLKDLRDNNVVYQVKGSKIISQGKMEKVKAIVLHRTSGYSTAGAVSSTIGAHFYIDGFRGIDGQIFQSLPLNEVAAHIMDETARTDRRDILKSNSIGIEVVGMCFDKDKKGNWFSSKYKFPEGNNNLSKSYKFDNGTHQWDMPTDKQINSLICLIRVLLKEYNLTKEDILCHEDIQSKRAGEGRLLYETIISKI